MIVTAHAPKRVSKLIFHLSSVLYPNDTMLSLTNRLLSGIICNKKLISQHSQSIAAFVECHHYSFDFFCYKE